MPAPYSVDLRTRVLAACDERDGSRKQIAERFRISESTLYLWLQQRKDEGRIEPKEHAGGRTSSVQMECLERLVEEQPDRTLEELACGYQDETGRSISTSWIARLLQRRGVTRKK